jgi:uncharacterized membrane protein YbhN (UPF0104 family)
MNDRSRARMWMIVRVALGALGLVVVGWLVREVGLESLRRTLVPALAYLPIAIVLELARVGMDAVSSHYSLGSKGQRVPPIPMFGAHLVATAIMGVAPAGRPTSEVVKAGLLSRWLGPASAAALAAANQANTLISSGTFTAFSAIAAYLVTGPSILTWMLVVHFVTMNASGLAIRAAARYARFGAWLSRRFPKLAPHVEGFNETTRETPLVPIAPVLAMMFGRLLQAAHFGVLAWAVGISPSVLGALALHGVYLVVAALGVMIPGQIGATEFTFTRTADALHSTVPQAMSIALLAHLVQLLLVIAGFVVLIFWRPPKPPPPPPTDPAVF